MDTISKKLLLSAGIGLGVALSSATLYLLLKPEEEEQYVKDKDNRKVRQNNQTVLTIRVPKQCVGAVIGRGGDHIKQLQLDTNTRIQFDDNNVNNGSDNKTKDKETKILIIKGVPENVAKAEVIINEIVRQQSLTITKKFSVDTSSVGAIIGRNGDNIRELCDRSGAKIKVDRNNKNSKTIMTNVSIIGTEEEIAEAVLLINKAIEENETFSRNRSHNNRHNKLKNYKILAIEDEPTDNSLNMDSYVAKLEPLHQNQLIEVFVSAVKTPEDFYIQIAGSVAQQLDLLMDETTDFYEVEDNRICFKSMSIKVGDIVAIPYQFDDHWYRAKVLSIEETPYSLEDSKVSVFYLDYGDEAVIKYGEICDLKDQILKRLPFQAIHCSLFGIRPTDLTGWSDEAINKFKELSHMALWKPLYAKVLQNKSIDGTNDRYYIELVDKTPKYKGDNVIDGDDWDSTVMSLDIRQYLIDNNFAEDFVNSNGINGEINGNN